MTILHPPWLNSVGAFSMPHLSFPWPTISLFVVCIVCTVCMSCVGRIRPVLDPFIAQHHTHMHCARIQFCMATERKLFFLFTAFFFLFSQFHRLKYSCCLCLYSRAKHFLFIAKRSVHRMSSKEKRKSKEKGKFSIDLFTLSHIIPHHALPCLPSRLLHSASAHTFIRRDGDGPLLHMQN